jgi:hypothetical protein
MWCSGEGGLRFFESGRASANVVDVCGWPLAPCKRKRYELIEDDMKPLAWLNLHPLANCFLSLVAFRTYQSALSALSGVRPR